jgi:replicative DNA helicase
MAKKNNDNAGTTLASAYVVELLALAMKRRSIFDIVKEHLKFSYLQDEAQKKLWQWIVKTETRTGRVPTWGSVQQQFRDNDAVLDILEAISEVEVGDEDLHDDNVWLEGFEKFIKKMKFLEVNDRITDLYNQGKKEQAWDAFVKGAEEFSSFTIQSAKFETVFGDFAERQALRQSEDYNKRFKVPTGIDELDFRLGGANGGAETGEFVLWMGESGRGKSQLGVHLGVTAARHGHRVAHFQLEGTKEQCMNRYDAAWTGTLYSEVKIGNIPANKLKVTQRIVEKLCRTDIIVSSEETFNAKTIPDIRREIDEMEKTYGKIDVIIIDYLELAEPGDGHNYSPSEERFRQTKLAKSCKMLAMEYNAVVHAFTQTSDVPADLRNDPDFVITRSYLNEDKGKVRPTDILITLNQTKDEYDENVMRLHTEKLRDYQNGNPIHICTNFSHARFYDRKRTMEIDWETYEPGYGDEN